ncbi:MAG: hypothetical protein JWN56_203 [Sphingobacteriales bacterium]|nr:hypothetical protein [Sphingobacteriales bacterium]
MKPMNKYGFLCLLLVTSSIITSFLPFKDIKEDETAVETTINSKHYLFQALTATPLGGGLIQLNSSNYDLVVSPGSIQCYLPFFGRAYSAPYGSSEGGIKFSSTDFDYSVKKKTKRGWSIVIKPNDNYDVRFLRLEVSKNGYASLTVISTDRQQMLFNGTIAAAK